MRMLPKKSCYAELINANGPKFKDFAELVNLRRKFSRQNILTEEIFSEFIFANLFFFLRIF